MKKSKRILAGILAFIMTVVGLYISESDKSKVQAADTAQLFAGYYTDDTYTTPSKTVTNYSKTVDADVLSVKLQIKKNTNGKYDMRVISSVDSLNYKNVGFEVYFDDATEPVTFNTTTVLTRINASKTGVEYKYSPKVIDTESEYFVTGTIQNIKAEYVENPENAKPFYIKPFWTTLDGTTVYGASRYLTVPNGYQDNNINLSLKMSDPGESVSVTLGSGTSATVVTATAKYTSDGYTHLNIPVDGGKSNLKSATLITVGDIVTYYRNLETKIASNEDTGDITWYTECYAAGEREFTIATDADLYGMLRLGLGNSYTGAVFYQIADIDANANAPATRTEWESYITSANPKTWPQIAFNGIYDGQGHTINGVYVNSTAAENAGLFTILYGAAQIKNLSLKNSYIYSTGIVVGGITGRSKGATITNVYTNAIVTSANASNGYVGGIAGYLDSDYGSTFEQCWSDADVKGPKTIGGFIGSIEKKTSTIRNSYFSGTLSTTSGNENGGLCGWIRADGVLNAENVIVEGSLNSANKWNIAALVGRNTGTTNLYNVYISRALLQLSPGNTSTAENAHYEAVNEKAPATTGYAWFADGDLDGEAGYLSTQLSFIDDPSTIAKEDIWTARVDKSPALKAWTVDSDKVDVTYVINADTSWYTSTAAGETYTISTANQLYGFAQLAQEGKLFEGQTIQLGADIKVNAGNATNWSSTNAPTNVWTPIKAFNGTFDGQGYYIDGIYVNTTGQAGFFALLYGSAKVQNFGLKNSYIYASGDMVGGIVANCKGATLTNIYTDATVTGANIIGGIVGYADSGYGTTISEVWFNGSVIATNRRAGAIFGGLQVQSSVKDVYYSGSITQQNSGTGAGTGSICGWLPVGGLDIQNCVIDGNISVANKYATGFLIGDNSGTVTISNVHIKNNLFPTGFNMGNGGGRADSHWGVVNGSVAPTTTGYTFFVDNSYDGALGYDALNATFGFTDNEETDEREDIWVARIDKAPGLKQWTPEEEVFDTSYLQVALGIWPSATEAVDYGAGNYVTTITNTTKTDYDAYLTSLAACSKKKSDNADGLAAQGVYNSVYTQNNLVINATYVEKINTTYISAGANQAVSEHLVYNADEVATNKSGAKTTLHMMEMVAWGNSFIIELKNGHFIINDGGSWNEYQKLYQYLMQLAEENGDDMIIIDAWTVSHLHWDHFNIMASFLDATAWKNNLRVNGFYINEPSERTKALEASATPSLATQIDEMHEAMELFTDENGNKTEIYRYQTGQRYYFNDITMDVVLAQEQIPYESYVDGFNETSTWLMFTIEGQKILIGGDAGQADMQYVMNAYDASYFDLDVFVAFHHGGNTWDEFTNFCTATNGNIGTVLFPVRANPTSAANTYLKSKADEWFYYGTGIRVMQFPYQKGQSSSIPDFVLDSEQIVTP